MLLRASLAGLLIAVAGTAAATERAPSRPNLCAAHGAGFASVPGTNTCVRVSGRVRGEVDAGSKRSIGGRNGASLNAEARAALDARTDTDAGPLRTVVRVRARRGEPSR
jgi:hypothetical protein